MDKDFLLNSYVSILITENALNIIFAKSPDFKTQKIYLIQELQENGVTLDDVKTRLKENDFTRKNYNEVMEIVKMDFDYCIKYNGQLKRLGDY